MRVDDMSGEAVISPAGPVRVLDSHRLSFRDVRKTGRWARWAA
jgi:hypothetical protein